VSNQERFDVGKNQSGIGLPVHGTLAHIHAAAHIAANCPTTEAYTTGLKIAVFGMTNYAKVVCEEVERIRNEIQNAIGESNERTHE
jgi:hypothetical protein